MKRKTKRKKKKFRKVWLGVFFLLLLGAGFWFFRGKGFQDKYPAEKVSPPGRVRSEGKASPRVAKPEPGANKKRTEKPKPIPPWPGVRRNQGEFREEAHLREILKRSEDDRNWEKALEIRIELSDRYLKQALWELSGFEPDLQKINRSLELWDEVVRRFPGTEYAATAMLERARVYHNGLNAVWDQNHREEARRGFLRVIELYPESSAAAEARQILSEMGIKAVR